LVLIKRGVRRTQSIQSVRLTIQSSELHCKEISIYVFPEKEFRGLSPDFHIHLSVSDLCIPMIGPPICLQQNRQTNHKSWEYINRSKNMNVGIGTVASQFRFWEYFFEFSVFFLCSVGYPTPSSAREFCPPPSLWVQWGRHTRLRGSEWGRPIPTMGHTLWYSICILQYNPSTL
jgi:hypothetical protein